MDFSELCFAPLGFVPSGFVPLSLSAKQMNMYLGIWDPKTKGTANLRPHPTSPQMYYSLNSSGLYRGPL